MQQQVRIMRQSFRICGQGVVYCNSFAQLPPNKKEAELNAHKQGEKMHQKFNTFSIGWGRFPTVMAFWQFRGKKNL